MRTSVCHDILRHPTPGWKRERRQQRTPDPRRVPKEGVISRVSVFLKYNEYE